jgi:hypothetical protein
MPNSGHPIGYYNEVTSPQESSVKYSIEVRVIDYAKISRRKVEIFLERQSRLAARLFYTPGVRTAADVEDAETLRLLMAFPPACVITVKRLGGKKPIFLFAFSPPEVDLLSYFVNFVGKFFTTLLKGYRTEYLLNRSESSDRFYMQAMIACFKGVIR